MKDLDRLIAYLQYSSEHIENVELCFTDMTDELLLQLLPVLSALPHLTTLALNGNWLTKAVLRELTDMLKDPKKFPSVTWIDLGNNVDIFSLPQPFLVSLKKRCPKQGNLPTILEFGEGQMCDLDSQEGPEGQEEPDCGQEKRKILHVSTGLPEEPLAEGDSHWGAAKRLALGAGAHSCDYHHCHQSDMMSRLFHWDYFVQKITAE